MLERERAQIWSAMGLGPMWIPIEAEDPLLKSVPSSQGEERRAALPVQGVRAPVSQTLPHREAVRPAPVRAVPVPQSASHAAAPAAVPSRSERVPVPAAQSPVRSRAASAEVPHELGEFLREADGADWTKLSEMVASCRGCALHSTRTRTVFGEGAPGCPIVMVGEAPGAEEDLQGKPFVGKSGQLLTAALTAVGIVRGKDAAVINVLKCRPPRNRDPKPEEVQVCRHFLDRQLSLLSPRVLVLMGRPAAHAVLRTEESIGRLRNRVHNVEINGKQVPAVVTYHPSYLLRSLGDKEKCWHDLLLVKRVLSGKAH